ncbi:SCO family protein [Allobranchiibius sp. GilTou73]|uniref:SCO family protein n=1 Tax=Allobranchiibius sp. GilTou73 TaxID=2904523 RepID=UPI001F2751D6|nr:SCO family protein [Allobranchiibius sp. GilTou73]UIJ34067.1 SCO family protein [Allobranchiibius sp. GilTou73]
MGRLKTVAASVAAVVCLAACSAQASGAGHSQASDSPASSAMDGIGTPLDSALPASIRDLRFTASDGRTVRLADFAGKTVAISDVMTLCQETCPADTATLVQTARAEDAARRGAGEEFLSITVDPQRDTVAQLAAYRRLFTPPPANWMALTGSPSAVNALWNYLGVWRQKVGDDAGPTPRNWRTGQPLTYDVQHSDEVFFLDPRGRERFVLEGAPYATKGSIPQTLQHFMDAEGRRNLSSASAEAWTQAQAQRVLSWVSGRSAA